MNDDYDVIEMDLPDYQEEHSAIPDVEDEISFAENKEEIYRRNRLIAAEEQAKQLKEAEREKLLRRERNEELIREAESAETYVIPKKIAVSAVIVFGIALFFVFVLVNNNSKAGVEYAYDEIVAETTVMRETAVTEKVTRVTTEKKKRETTAVTEESETAGETTEAPTEITTEAPIETTTAEIPPEVLKTMIVREPFAEDGNSYIYNTAVMSYRFTAENGGINEYGVKKITIYVSVKNLTDYEYLVIPYFRSFRLTDSSSGNYQDCDLSDYDREHTHFSSSFKYEDDEEWREGSPVAFSFDENSLCEFSLDIYFDTESDIEYDTFEYDPQNGFPKYYENADVGFEIPLSEILKYVK